MNRVSTAIVTVVSLISLAAVAGCTASPPPTPPSAASTHAVSGDAEAILSAQGLSDLSPREVVEALDQDPAPRPLSLMASVRYDEVTLDDGTLQASLPLDGDDFYISVAPYENQTHDCYFHSLGTCQGELTETDVHISVVSEDGETLVDKDATTYANGFVGFWVPKDIRGTITITRGDVAGEVEFSSDDEGPTCITGLQLG
ncbi:MAG: CueP family metal-binding protein [Arachnia sp.]